MTHVNPDLLAYLDGELSPTERQAVEAHLQTCPSCQTTLLELRALQAGLTQVIPAAYESVHLPADADARIRKALADQRVRQEGGRSWEQLLAGLITLLRPLSKAAIPLVALFFVALTANIARLPVQSGAQQTLVLGQDTYTPGTEASVRVLIQDVESNQPIESANVAVRLRQPGRARTVYAGNTDATGSAPVRFTVPDDWQGDAELVVETNSDLGETETIAPIRLERSYRLLLGSDKPVYQPGETIHLRTLTLGKVDNKPADGLMTRFQIVDAAGNQILAEDVRTSEFGIAGADVALAANAPQGPYQVRATQDDTVSELSVQVSQAELPAFRVDVEADADYYLPGELLSGQVSAGYFFGRPIAQGPVDIRLLATRLDPAATDGEQQVFVQELSGVTDDQGLFPFQFELPKLADRAFGEEETLDLSLEVTVTEPWLAPSAGPGAGGRSEFGWRRLTLARQPILIDVVAEGGTLRAGLENILYVLSSYPDGRPAPASLSLQIGSGPPLEETTNEFGLAEVRYTPRAEDTGTRTVQVTANDAAERVAQTTVELPLDEGRETLLLRTDQAFYLVGDTLAMEALATGTGDAVYLDVIKGGQILLTQAASVENGRATFAVDLTPDLAGTLELSAYQLTSTGEALRDSRVVVVDSPQDLTVQLATEQEQYRPGDEALITAQVQEDGEGVQAAVGIAVVNEAVYAQREYQPGFARLYFFLEEALQDTGISPPVAASGQGTALQAAQQQTAKASWAAYQPREYNLNAQATDLATRSAVNQTREEAFGQLSLVLTLMLTLVPLLIAAIVILGLRRSDVLGKAVARVLLTIIVLAGAGVALLAASQALLDLLAERQELMLLGTSLLWLATLLGLFVLAWRDRDHRTQFVALLVLAYAILLALLAFTADQGATIGSTVLVILAAGFGMLLAGMLLLGWGLRLEGRKTLGSMVLILALLVVPLVVAINAADLTESNLIQEITGPTVYGLHGGFLLGCAAAPQQAPAMPAAEEAAPEAEPMLAAEGEVSEPGEMLYLERTRSETTLPEGREAFELRAQPDTEATVMVEREVEATEQPPMPAPMEEPAEPAEMPAEEPAMEEPASAAPLVKEAPGEEPEPAPAVTPAPIATDVEEPAPPPPTAGEEEAEALALSAETAAEEPALKQAFTPTTGLAITATQAAETLTLPYVTAGGEEAQEGIDARAIMTPTRPSLVEPVLPRQATTEDITTTAPFPEPSIARTETTTETLALALAAGEKISPTEQSPLVDITTVPTKALATVLPPPVTEQPPAALAAEVTEAESPIPEPTPAPLLTPRPSPVPTEEVTAALAAPTPERTTPTPSFAPEPTLTPTPAPISTAEPTVTLLPLPLPTLPGLGGGIEAPQPTTPTPLPPEALPIIRQRFPQTLYWNPEVLTDERGRLQLPVPVGDTITTWRITALAVDRSGKLGSATAPLVVFQPLFLEPQLPAAMPVGEELVAPVWIFNYSSEPLAVTLTAQASPGLQTQVAEGTIEVPANDGTVAAVGLRALAPGPQTVLLLVRGDGVQDARQVDVTVNGE